MPIYVQHEVLGKVNDVFNADAIWQAPGLALFARKPLLRDLLERSPREHRGRAATRCFAHVTLMLPQEEVDDDRHLSRGARARDLAQSLARLHQKDFGDLLGGDEVRYDVVGTPAVAPGQIEVKFGHAVYLAGPDEKIQYHVTLSRDSAVWQAVGPIYPNQRLALIGADADSASYVAPAWPFGPECAILLINDGGDAPLEVQMRPKEALCCSYDALNGYYVIKAARAGIDGGAGPRLLMKVTRVSSPQREAPVRSAVPAPAAMPAAPAATGAVWKARQGVPGTEGDATAAPQAVRTGPAGAESDATYAPLSQQRVSVVALALPRLSRYRDTGARAIEICMDQQLNIVRNAQDALISFAVDNSDELYACTGAGRERIAAPANFAPLEGQAVKLLAIAPDMAERYCATLCLPHPVCAALPSGARFVFGRGAPMLAKLRVLDSARHLLRAQGAKPCSADRIGLSRNAFSVEAATDGFKIGRLSATQALYHLDPQLRFVATIGAIASEQPYLLPSGHHLVAGHYVLRFDA
ncbi:MAG: hypothetical protein V4582_15520 [Pseudomonadota bacterium]